MHENYLIFSKVLLTILCILENFCDYVNDYLWLFVIICDYENVYLWLFEIMLLQYVSEVCINSGFELLFLRNIRKLIQKTIIEWDK